MPSPNPPGSDNSGFLHGVAASSSANPWAVGNRLNASNGAFLTLIVHWNGRSWARVPSPNPAGSAGDNQLFAVTAASATSAWATGFSVSRAEQTLIEHWNGRSWAIMTSPNPGGPTRDHELTAADATSASNAWTVGLVLNPSSGIAQTLTEHWNGRSWSHVASPNPGGSSVGNELTGVAASSPADAWAVGEYGNSTAHFTLFEHWNGRAWAHVAD